MKYFTLLLFSLICLHSLSQANKNIQGNLIIFHAGSLSVPFKEIITAFNKEYPGVKVQTEIAGSVDCARKITELKKPCDIMASADYKVIDELLIPNHSDWNIKFATNEMAIVYTEKSRYQQQINSQNWYEILLKSDVAYGRSDPNADPCGYRTALTLKLADNYYKKPGLAEQIIGKDKNYIRPKEVDLLGLLESHAIDYIFLYRSVAIQHKLKYLILPDEINLKSPKFAADYSKVSTEIKGSKPGDKKTMKGEAMVYGITALKNAPNKAAAEAFLLFLLTKTKGLAIMEKNGQQSLSECSSTQYEKLPAVLKPIVTKY